MKASFAIAQDQGRRKRQEDYAAFEPSTAPGLDGAPDLVVLADGMGGHAGGDTASRTAVEAALQVWRRTAGQPDVRARLRAGVLEANDALDRAIDEAPALEGMGCTLVALRPSREGLLWLSVGDSPLWLIRGREVIRLNADHSHGRQLDAMAEAGLISAEEAANERGRNQLQHALTGEPIEAMDEPWSHEPLRVGDLVVLASDGLDVLSRDELVRACAGATDAHAAALSLLGAVLAKQAPNQDNVTIAVLRAEAAPRARLWWLTALATGLSVLAAVLVAAALILVGPRIFTHSAETPAAKTGPPEKPPTAAKGPPAGPSRRPEEKPLRPAPSAADPSPKPKPAKPRPKTKPPSMNITKPDGTPTEEPT